MQKDFVAERQVVIDAPVEAVWQTLTDPALVKQYMYGTRLETDWQVGSPISWKGEYQGAAYEDKGRVLAFEPGRRLEVTHWSPMGGSEDKPENYHTVTYELDSRQGSTVLTLKQSNNPSPEAARTMAEQNWAPVLEKLKEVAEGASAG